MSRRLLLRLPGLCRGTEGRHSEEGGGRCFCRSPGEAVPAEGGGHAQRAGHGRDAGRFGGNRYEGRQSHVRRLEQQVDHFEVCLRTGGKGVFAGYPPEAVDDGLSHGTDSQSQQ